MSREQAHAVLNAAQAGAPVPLPIITAALRATGDLGVMPRNFTPPRRNP